MNKWKLAGGSLLLAAASAAAADTGVELGALSYMRISLDSARSVTQPQFGLAIANLQQATPQGPSVDLTAAPRMVDMRMSDGQVQEIWLNRTRFAVRDPHTGRLNAFGDMDDPATWAVGGLAVLGVLCITETWICEDDDAPPPPPPE